MLQRQGAKETSDAMECERVDEHMVRLRRQCAAILVGVLFDRGEALEM